MAVRGLRVDHDRALLLRMVEYDTMPPGAIRTVLNNFCAIVENAYTPFLAASEPGTTSPVPLYGCAVDYPAGSARQSLEVKRNTTLPCQAPRPANADRWQVLNSGPSIGQAAQHKRGNSHQSGDASKDFDPSHGKLRPTGLQSSSWPHMTTGCTYFISCIRPTRVLFLHDRVMARWIIFGCPCLP